MVRGIDTTFLLQLELRESAGHDRATQFLLSEVADKGEILGLAPQVLTEFIHIATDPARFQHPLSAATAVRKAEFWWNAKEVRPVYPTYGTVTLFCDWMERHGLGRKRVLNTFLAATYVSNDILSILSTNARDYRIFDALSVVDPAAAG